MTGIPGEATKIPAPSATATARIDLGLLYTGATTMGGDPPDVGLIPTPQLLERLCGDPGDHEAAHQFNERYGPAVVTYARRRGCGLSTALDLFQDLSLALIRNSAFRVNTSRSVRGYLWASITRLVSRAHRGKNRRRMLGGGGNRDQPLGVVASLNNACNQEQEILREAMDRARARTTPERWRMFDLVIQGMAQAEVAALLGIHPGNVSRGVSEVRKMVEFHARELREFDR